jgi:hypothetical protein
MLIDHGADIDLRTPNEHLSPLAMSILLVCVCVCVRVVDLTVRHEL